MRRSCRPRRLMTVASPSRSTEAPAPSSQSSRSTGPAPAGVSARMKRWATWRTPAATAAPSAARPGRLSPIRIARPSPGRTVLDLVEEADEVRGEVIRRAAPRRHVDQPQHRRTQLGVTGGEVDRAIVDGAERVPRGCREGVQQAAADLEDLLLGWRGGGHADLLASGRPSPAVIPQGIGRPAGAAVQVGQARPIAAPYSPSRDAHLPPRARRPPVAGGLGPGGGRPGVRAREDDDRRGKVRRASRPAPARPRCRCCRTTTATCSSRQRSCCMSPTPSRRRS